MADLSLTAKLLLKQSSRATGVKSRVSILPSRAPDSVSQKHAVPWRPFGYPSWQTAGMIALDLEMVYQMAWHT